MWGVNTGITWTFSARASLIALKVSVPHSFDMGWVIDVSWLEVEKEIGCRKLMLQWFSDGCVFGNIFSMVENEIPTNKLLDPKAMKFRKSAWCYRHQKECVFEIPQSPDGIGVLGAPCVLFSKNLGCFQSDNNALVYSYILTTILFLSQLRGCSCFLRMGKQEGFTDIEQGQCHSVGTKAMQLLAASVHENVPEFDEVHWCIHDSFKLDVDDNQNATQLQHKMQCITFKIHVNSRRSFLSPLSRWRKQGTVAFCRSDGLSNPHCLLLLVEGSNQSCLASHAGGPETTGSLGIQKGWSGIW